MRSCISILTSSIRIRPSLLRNRPLLTECVENDYGCVVKVVGGAFQPHACNIPNEINGMYNGGKAGCNKVF